MPDFVIAQGNLPKVIDTLFGSASIDAHNGPSGAPPLDLTGCTVQFIFQSGAGTFASSAQILNATGGQVSYTFAAGQTDSLGTYQAQWKVTFSNGQVLNLPGRFIYFDIVDAVPVAVALSTVTPVRMTIEPVRALLGDFPRHGIYRYEDSAVAKIVRALVQMGELDGYGLTPDLSGITPVILNPKIFGVLIYKAAKRLLLPHAAAYGYRMRAMSESFGEQKGFVADLENALYDLQNPTMFGSYQSFYSWLGGVTGLDVWTMMTQMKVDAPIATAELNISGLYINSGGPATPR